MILLLAHFYAHARHTFARKMAFFSLHEGDYAIFGGMDREISAHVSARTSDLGSTSLADQNFAIFDFLSTESLHAKPLPSIVMDVLGGTASFDM